MTIGVLSLSVILLVLIGVILPHLLRKESAKRERFIETSNKFLQSFEPELLVLHNEGDITAYESLRNAFNKHYNTVTEFRRNLKGDKATDFNAVWDIYCHSFNVTSLQKYQSTGNHDETKKRRLEALHNLESVLKLEGYKPPK